MGNPSNKPQYLGYAIVGQETAFAHFLEDNRPHMTAQLNRLTKDAQLAKDLYQDTVLHLWEKREELYQLNIRQPEAWLWTCVHNRWRAYRAREQRRQEIRDTWEISSEDREGIPFTSEQSVADMARLISKVLSPLQEQIIQLVCQGFPPREIAQQLSLTAKQVHQQIYLTRKKLKPFFKEEN